MKFFKSKKEETLEVKVEEKSAEPRPFDYGLDLINIYLRSGDYGWEIDENSRKVILTNPQDCKEKVNLFGLIAAWRETGHAEWEAIMAYLFLEPIVNAINNNETEADISDLFNRSFTARGGKTFSKEEVYNHVIKTFEVVEETPERILLKLKI